MAAVPAATPRRRCSLLRAALTLILLLGWSGCRQQDRITVLHAGSLSRLLGQAARRFEAQHPALLIRSEAAGSLDTLRKVTELGRHADLVLVADNRLIDRFLVPRFARRSHLFLGNELVLASARRLGSEKETWENDWQEKLGSGRYSYGISDPDRDPAGYFAQLSWKLASIHYRLPGLYRRLLLGLDHRWIRPRSSQLVALLESGSLDFAFLYRSTALQNNLDFITLPPQVSLGQEIYREEYGQVFLTIQGDRPASRIEISGAPIRYGLALLIGARPQARLFFDYLLSPEIRDVGRELGYIDLTTRQESGP